MGFLSDIFGRVGRVTRGQANKGVDILEDATFEATVKQTVLDMKTELNKVVQASASAMSNYNRLDAEYQKYSRQSTEWKTRAGQALDAGNEDLARKALAKKAESDKQVASMETALQSARASSEQLKSQVLELKRKIEEGERTAATLVARIPVAVAQRLVAAGRRHQSPATMALDQVFDDRPGFGDRAALVADHRRLAQRVHLAQFGGRQHRLRVALVAHDLVGQLQFLEQPQHALRAGVVQMVHGDHRQALRRWRPADCVASAAGAAGRAAAAARDNRL